MHVDPHAAGRARIAHVRVEMDRGLEHDAKRTGAPAVASQSMIEAAIFDYGGVISSPLFRGVDHFEIDMGYPAGSILELLFGESGYLGPGDGDPCDGAAPPEAAAVTHDWHRLETGELSLAEYLDGVMERAPAVLGKPLDLEAYQRFGREMPIGVHWPVVHRIRDLKGAGLRLALLTNNVREFGDTWRSMFPVDELFEVVVDSSAVGMRKPDHRIYRLTCERVGVEPRAAVFVDDNRDNIEAAREVGMEAVHFGDDPWDALAALDAVLERRGIPPAPRGGNG
jgi:putative hydrolase of the HAD superfamily